jgi:DDB1- and CUL4-associated factor 6
VSGIDHTIKIFSPDARARDNARRGIGVRASDTSTFSSIGIGRRRSRPSQTDARPDIAVNDLAKASDALDEDDDDEEGPVAPHGLASRKRMQQEYEITSQNDVDRQGGNQDAYITVGQLLLLMAP